MLTPAQAAEFKAQGAVLLPGFVERSVVEGWREQAWEAIRSKEGAHVCEADRSTWPAGYIGNVEGGTQPKPPLGSLPQFGRLVEWMGGGTLRGGGHMLKAIFPAKAGDEPNEGRLGRGPTAAVRAGATVTPSGMVVAGPSGDHMDGSGHHRLAATLLLTDCEEGGGCFMYWKGGHRRIHKFWRQHPEYIGPPRAGTEEFHDTPPFVARGWSAIHDDGGTCDARGTQFVGKAGDCVLWHGWCPHSQSVNLRSVPRLALVARWDDAVPLRDENGERTFHVPESADRLFEHWSPELNAAGDSSGAAKL